MNAFFSYPENAARLLTVIVEWHDTPFRKFSCVKGVAGGADCVCFVQSCLFAAGAIPELKFDRRPRDYSGNVFNRKLLEYFRGELVDDPQSAMLAERFAELAIEAPLITGDVLVLKGGQDLYHLLLVTEPPRCMQCAPPLGVSECDATDPQYHDRFVTLFRARA
jgi:hypothetical protein